MESKPFYPLDLPDSVKSLLAQSGADSNAVPQSENRVYPASDLLKLAPTSLKDKMKSQVTSTGVTEDTDAKQDTESGATVQNATEVRTETTTDKAGQTTTEGKTVKLETVEEALCNEVTEGRCRYSRSTIFCSRRRQAKGGVNCCHWWPCRRRRRRRRRERARRPTQMELLSHHRLSQPGLRSSIAKALSIQMCMPKR